MDMRPSDWNREVAPAYVAAVDRATIGQWSFLGVSGPALSLHPLLKDLVHKGV